MTTAATVLPLSELLAERVFFEGGVIRPAAKTREAEVTCPAGATASDRGLRLNFRGAALQPVGRGPGVPS